MVWELLKKQIYSRKYMEKLVSILENIFPHCLGIIEEAEIFQDIQGKMSVNTGKYMFPLFGIGTYQ